MKIRESCLQTGNFIYKPGISLTKQDFHLQRGSLGLQRGFSGYYLPFYLQFLTHSPICIVLSAQYYTLFICHSAYFSSNSLCFLSIISSILAIYCPTSLTFSHLSMRCVPSGFGTGQTRFVLAPAPQATIVCFSSKTTPYHVLPYITQYYRFKLIIANPYT